MRKLIKNNKSPVEWFEEFALLNKCNDKDRVNEKYLKDFKEKGKGMRDMWTPGLKRRNCVERKKNLNVKLLFEGYKSVKEENKEYL